jgi:hypothetical protein
MDVGELLVALGAWKQRLVAKALGQGFCSEPAGDREGGAGPVSSASSALHRLHVRPDSDRRLNWALLLEGGRSRQLGDAFINKAIWKIPLWCVVTQSPSSQHFLCCLSAWSLEAFIRALLRDQ